MPAELRSWLCQAGLTSIIFGYSILNLNHPNSKGVAAFNPQDLKKKCRPRYGHSRGTLQHRRPCQNSCSIHVYVVPTAAEYVQHCVRFVNVKSSLPENVIFSVCAHMGNAAYIIFIMWNSISGLDAWYYFRFNVSYGVAVTVRSNQIEFQVIF